MKTFTQSSRFIQPKKVGHCNELHVVEVFDSHANQKEVHPNTSPQSATDFNIVEELCSLEQQYSKSFSKWDNIRRMDEREHAIMQGKALVPYDEDITPRELLTGNNVEMDKNIVRSVEDEANMGLRAIVKHDGTGITTSKSTIFDVVLLQRFVLWYTFLLVMLRFANFLTSTR